MNGTGDRKIDAAILSVGHTFQVQNYERGDRGTLIVLRRDRPEVPRNGR